MLMHMLTHPDPLRQGGEGCVTLELHTTEFEPLSPSAPFGLYAFADASLASPPTDTPLVPAAKSVTGGAVMLAGACLLPLAQRQHLAAPDVHTSELVGAGTVTQFLIVFREQLHEMRVPQELPSPLFLDSQSTFFAATNEGSVKKSVWSLRRAVVIQEAVALKIIKARKIGDTHNLADIFTKYIKYEKWRRMMDVLLNIHTHAPPLVIVHGPKG